MLIPGGKDLWEVEEDIRVVEARLEELKAKTIKMPWERKEEKNLQAALGKLEWKKISIQEHVRANPVSAEIYDRENSRSSPSVEGDHRRLLAFKMKMKSKLKI